MNTTTTDTKKQAECKGKTKSIRSQRREEVRFQEKEVRRRKKELVAAFSPRTREKEDAVKKATEILENMKALTWRELETAGKFSKNDKLLTFVKEDMLIVGCDVGSETHFLRAIDARGIEFSKKAFGFENSLDGFEKAKEWMLDIAARNEKTQIVMGLEPTGHYWFDLAVWMIANEISVVQVNPYAVKQSKEIEDNSQRKDDRKDPKIIANLVKDGNFGIPYLPTGAYADLRRLSMFRDQLTEDYVRAINRLHRDMKIYFPEYKDAYRKIDGAFSISLLKEAPFPGDLIQIGADGIREIWKKAKVRGRGYSRTDAIIQIAQKSVGMKDGIDAARETVKWFAEELERLAARLRDIERQLWEKCAEIPYAENILEIPGIGKDILSGILSEIGDIDRFDDAKEIQKLSGLGLIECSSGKHNGQTKISHRGRKKLRYWLFLGTKSLVVHDEVFRSLHEYYTTRDANPLKKMQSLIVIACKLLRVIYKLLKSGVKYDPVKMQNDIRRAVSLTAAA